MENLFVIFPPGCAGNHLANIISTSNRFTKRYADDVYDTLGPRAHIANGKNYELTQEEFKNKQSQCNVFCSHLAEYLKSQELTEQYFPNRKYVIVEMPENSRNNFFINRVCEICPVYQNSYFIEEIAMMYSIQHFSRLTNEHDMTSITVDKIFTNNISTLVTSLNAELGLNLDINEIKHIHNKWIEKNKKYV